AQVGSLSKPAPGDGKAPNEDLDDGEDRETKGQPKADLMLIYCFGNAVGVSRKVDPDLPIVNQQQIIHGVQQLDYNRRTGEFYVPGPGKVYLYDRNDRSSELARKDADRNSDANKPDRTSRGNSRQTPGRTTSSDRTVTPTSGRTSVRTTGAPPAARSDRPAT